MTYKAAINYFTVIIFNAVKLKNELVNIYAKNAKILEADVLVKNLLSIFSKEEFRENKLEISTFLHREHLKTHVRILIILTKSIRREFLKWHATLKSQAEILEAEKFLIMIVAKHLLKILERKRMKIIDDEGNLFEVNEESV